MGHFFVGPHEEVTAVRQGRETRGAARKHHEAMAFELEIADDFGTEKAVDVAGGRDLKARPEFLGHHAAADDFAPFEHKDFSSGAG